MGDRIAIRVLTAPESVTDDRLFFRIIIFIKINEQLTKFQLYISSKLVEKNSDGGGSLLRSKKISFSNP
jgi:hypothetical protein